MHKCHKLSGKCFDNFLGGVFGSLGKTVATNPFIFILVPLLITALCGTGFQRLVYESDPTWLFVPIGAPSEHEKYVVDDKFPLNGSRYVRGTETRIPKCLDIIITPKHGLDVIDKEIWIEAQKLSEAIERVTLPSDDGRDLYTWDDLCARWEGKCIGNEFLELSVFMDKIKSGQMNLTFPLMTHPFTYKVYPLISNFGGVQLEDGSLMEARVMKLSYVLRDDNGLAKLSDEWVELVRIHLTNIDHKWMKFTMDIISSKSIEFELNDNMSTMMDCVPLSIILMLGFTVFNCMSTDWVRSKPLMGVVGLGMTLLSCIAGFGTVVYCGVPWQAINLVGIFLIIGIGLDDTFIMLAAWWRSEETEGRDLVARMMMTYTDAGVSITITSLTNILSFVIGAAIPGFPCVQIFCVYTGCGLAFTYIWTITFFGGLLTWAAYLEHADRHCLLFMKVLSKSESADCSWFYRRLCSGGVGNLKDSKAKVKLTKDSKFMVFFRDIVAPIMNKPAVKCIIIIIFIIYLGISAYGITMLKEGLQIKNLVRDDSYATNFYNCEDKYFREFPYRIQAVIFEKLDYSNETTQENVIHFMEQVENSPYISNINGMGQSWLTEYFNFISRNYEYLAYNISSQEEFNHHLFTFLQEIKGFPISEDVCQDGDSIFASRFMFQTDKIENAQEEVKLLKELRRLASEAPFDLVFYNPLFPFIDQYAEILGNTINCIICCCVTMTVITLIFIPNRICVAWVAFTIMSIEVGVVGFMAWWDINLDVISMIELIMGIGFSVDFSAHISYHYLSAGCGKETTPFKRLSDCLYAMGPPIIQGSMTTMLGAAGLLLHPSYLTRSFVRMLFLVMVLGVSHGLLLLPVLLTLFGPGSCMQKQESNEDGNLKDICNRPRLQSPISVHNLLESPTRKGLTPRLRLMTKNENQWMSEQANHLAKRITSESESALFEEDSLVSHISSSNMNNSSRYMERNTFKRSSMVLGTPPVVKNSFRPRAMSLILESGAEDSDGLDVRARRYSTTTANLNDFTSIQYYINKHQSALNSSALSRINHDSMLGGDCTANPISNQGTGITEFVENNNLTGIDNPVFQDEESKKVTSTPCRKNEVLSVYNSEDRATIKHRKAALERLEAYEKANVGPGFDI